jgi:hypothetical protein
MITNCPNCNSTRLDFAQGICLDCYQKLDVEAEAAGQELAVLQQASDAMDGAQTAEEKDQSFESWENKVFDYYDKGFRIVTLIGFSGAGKTFFAHRLRRELAMNDWTSVPEHSDTVVQSAATIEWTQLVKRGAHPHRRVLADCDGEAFRTAVEHLLHGKDIGPDLRRYMVITALASAYILMLPAPALLDRRNNVQTSRLIERFDVIVKAILALKRSVRESGDAREAVRRGLKREYVLEALEHEFRCEQPLHVLFAQADKLPASQQYDRDPHMYALLHANTLYRTIESHFSSYRFDFVTAFDGHLENIGGEVDYNLPSYGTVAAFDWIDRMLEGGRLRRMQTAAAMKVRRLIDGRFRKSAARVAG